MVSLVSQAELILRVITLWFLVSSQFFGDNMGPFKIMIDSSWVPLGGRDSGGSVERIIWQTFQTVSLLQSPQGRVIPEVN